MGFTTVVDKSDGDVFTAAMWNTYIRDNFNTGVPVLLANSTLSGSASSIDFTSIAQDWAHLYLIAYLRGTTAAAATAIWNRFNGDSGSNYDYQILQGVGALAGGSETFAAAQMGLGAIPAASASGNVFAPVVMEIPHYSQSSNNKSVTAQIGHKSGTSTGNMNAYCSAGFWRSSAAISQVTLLPAAGDFASGSRATLYGVP